MKRELITAWLCVLIVIMILFIMAMAVRSVKNDAITKTIQNDLIQQSAVSSVIMM